MNISHNRSTRNEDGLKLKNKKYNANPIIKKFGYKMENISAFTNRTSHDILKNKTVLFIDLKILVAIIRDEYTPKPYKPKL